MLNIIWVILPNFKICLKRSTLMISQQTSCYSKQLMIIFEMLNYYLRAQQIKKNIIFNKIDKIYFKLKLY